MDIILLERVSNLGRVGDVVTVKDGYARNFLLPKGKAARATSEKIAEFEKKRHDIEARDLTVKADAEKVATRMDNVSIVLIRQASDSGHLYGSIKAKDVSDALTTLGYTVARDQVILDTPIKELGLHKVRVALHADVSVWVTANVALSEEEAAAKAAAAAAAAAGGTTSTDLAPSYA